MSTSIVLINCSEFSVILSTLMRNNYNKYLYLLDMNKVGDFIMKYMFNKVVCANATHWLTWDRDIEEQYILDEIDALFKEHLPMIKTNAYTTYTEFLDNIDYETVATDEQLTIVIHV